MKLVYEAWLCVFAEKEQFTHSNHLIAVFIAFFELIILAQSSQFFWYPTLSISEWSTLKLFWESFNFASIDYAAVTNNLIRQFLLMEISLFSIAIISLFFIALLKSQNKVIPYFIISVSKYSLIALCDLLFIPTNIFFLLIIKYSSGKYTSIAEYDVILSAENFNYGTFGQVFGVIILCLICILTLFYEACSCDIRPRKNNKRVFAKIQAKINVITKCLQLFNCCAFISFQMVYYRAYLLIVFGMYFFVFCLYVYFTPYYWNYMNFLKALNNLDCAIISLSFFVGYVTDSAAVVLSMFLILQIPLIVICKEMLYYRMKKVIDFSVDFHRNFYIYEISLRKHLQDPNIKSKIMKKMNENFVWTKNNINLTIQAYYCFDVLKNPILGLNKISGLKISWFNIFEGFQIYKCKSLLTGKCLETSETLRLLYYFIDFEKSKSTDEKFCELYYKFLKEIMKQEPNFKILKTYVSKMMIKIRKLRMNYESILDKFPAAPEVKEYYGSFLLYIANDTLLGQEFLKEARDEGNFVSRQCFRTTLCAIQNRSYAVFSGEKKSLGKIIFYNKNLLNLLGYTNETIEGVYLDSLIPMNVKIAHKKYLKKYLNDTLTHEVFTGMTLFLMKNDGFLVECISNCEIVANGDSVSFLCMFDPVEAKNHEFAIIDIDGVIINHSKDFAKILAINRKILEGKLLKEFINFDMDDIEIGENFKVNCLSTYAKLTGVVRRLQIKSTIFNVFYISDDEFSDTKDPTYSQRYDTITDSRFEMRIKSATYEKVKTNQLTDGQSCSRHSRSNYSASVTFLNGNEAQALAKAIKVLNIAKIVLIIIIIVLIACSISSLAYISSEVNHSNSLTAFTHLSDLSYVISETALILRTIDICLKEKIPSVLNITHVNENLIKLVSLQQIILEDYNSWSYCKGSQIVKENIIPYWDLQPEPVLLYTSLHNIIGDIIKHANTIISKMLNNDFEYKKSMFFIIYNSLGMTLTKVSKSINSLEKCEMSRLEHLTTVKTYLLIIAVSLTGISILFIVYYLTGVDKCLNALWEYLKRRVFLCFHDVRRALKIRFMKYHNRDNIKVMDFNEDIKFVSLSFKHSLRYLIRFTPLFLFAGVFYIIASFIIYENIHKFLIQRPKLLSSIYSRKVMAIELFFYTVEAQVQETEYSLDYIYP
ncbi:hypothetical protein SteCoe_864 [Stentor coeruleus]|uniref:TmcB/TmcC TPR repeats domain-containing protein n=1 Tax=Stentor coeruleus TaxID=5963 RepID=A0A1R2D2Z9_9CILI|nr:hypothetical protein SteCoe_864 [Stentor coeruleus]